MEEENQMGAHEYLEKYIRTVPGGAIAWERSLFSHSGKWGAGDLIDAAVDIAWDLFSADSGSERPALDIHRAGNYFVISPRHESMSGILELAA